MAAQLEGRFRVDGKSSLSSPQGFKLSPGFQKSAFQLLTQSWHFTPASASPISCVCVGGRGIRKVESQLSEDF